MKNDDLISVKPMSMAEYLKQRKERKQKGLFVFDYITYITRSKFSTKEKTIYFDEEESKYKLSQRSYRTTT